MAKQHKVWLLGAVTLLLSVACTKLDYDGEYNSDGNYTSRNEIYWLVGNGVDSVYDKTFGNEPLRVTDYTIELPLRVLGRMPEREMAYRVVADPTSTAEAGVHYAALPERLIVPAGSMDVRLSIRLLRDGLPKVTAEEEAAGITQELVDSKTRTLVLRLEPTEDFGITINNGQLIRISANDILSQPAWWTAFRVAGNIGVYHPEKYRALLEQYDGNSGDILLDILNYRQAENPATYLSRYFRETTVPTQLTGSRPRFDQRRYRAYSALHAQDPERWAPLMTENELRNPYQ